MKDFKRIMECMKCVYIDICFNTINDPEEYADGTCKTKYMFESLKGGNEDE